MSAIQELVFQPFITPKSFSSIMSTLQLYGNVKIAVAVSGGSDSLCLLLMLHKWAKLNGATIVALIVNHQLRDNINEEIEQVSNWISSYKIPIQVLNINKINTLNKLQQNARQERYRVLLDYCKKNKIFYLAVAHHFNDLIETVNMRKRRSENLWGQAGISILKNFKDVLVFRPLLFFTKEAIKNTLRNMNQLWVEDPSNENIKFERVKERKTLGFISNDLLYEYYENINKSREERIKLEKESLNYLVKYCNISNLGVVSIDLEEFLKLDNILQVAILRILIQFCSQKNYMFKIKKIKSLIINLKQSTLFNSNKKITLGGTLMFISTNQKSNVSYSKNILNIVKENRFNQHKFYYLNKLQSNMLLWDGRFLIKNLHNFDKNCSFASINSNEYNFLCRKKKFKEILKAKQLNKEILFSLPWLFNKQVPCFDWILKLLDSNYVRYYPLNSLYKDLFYNFTIAKQVHLD